MKLQYRSITAMLVCVVAFLGCETTPKPPGQTPAPGSAAVPPPNFPNVTLEMGPEELGGVVRRLGEEYGGGLVVMNGLEDFLLSGVRLNDMPYDRVAAELAKAAECVYERTPYYYFLYPEGYEALLEIRVAYHIHPDFHELSAALSFGANTALHNVAAILSHNLGVTVVADNAMAEVLVGEVTLPDLPLPEALDAILKSARVAPAAFVVESTEEYVLLLDANNRQPRTALLNAQALSGPQLSLLERRVDVTLPQPTGGNAQIPYQRAAAALRDILPTLSAQIGAPVRAEAALHDLPVNVAAYRGVRVRTVMDLLVRQWLVPAFGYEVREDGIYLRRR